MKKLLLLFSMVMGSGYHLCAMEEESPRSGTTIINDVPATAQVGDQAQKPEESAPLLQSRQEQPASQIPPAKPQQEEHQEVPANKTAGEVAPPNAKPTPIEKAAYYKIHVPYSMNVNNKLVSEAAQQKSKLRCCWEKKVRGMLIIILHQILKH